MNPWSGVWSLAGAMSVNVTEWGPISDWQRAALNVTFEDISIILTRIHIIHEGGEVLQVPECKWMDLPNFNERHTFGRLYIKNIDAILTTQVRELK